MVFSDFFEAQEHAPVKCLKSRLRTPYGAVWRRMERSTAPYGAGSNNRILDHSVESYVACVTCVLRQSFSLR